MLARHTVTVVEDTSLTSSDPISPPPSEIQNLNPPTDNTQTPELFLDNDLLEDNNTFLEEESNNELIPPSNLYNQRFSTGAFNIDNYTEPNACYNKFLHYHRLPSFSAPQTIRIFLQNICEYFPIFYSNEYIRITIKQYPFHNTVFTEGHIYLPHERILPGHTTYIPIEELSEFYKLELKSFYLSTNITNLTTSIQTQSILNQPNTHNLNLTIATHNVRGFNVASKRQIWEDYCTNHNISIASITETKISHKTKLSFCNNNLYTYYWANSNSSIKGTAIMIQNHLKPHVYSCLTHHSGAIALDLFFKSNIKLHVISVYLSSTDSTKRNLTQNTVINWILQAQQLNLQPIILGDFNTHNTTFSSLAKFKLINFLHCSNMFDIGAHFNNTHYTWSNGSRSSCIDYIWTNIFNV